MNFKEMTGQIKNWAVENKRKLFIGAGVIAGMAIVTILVKDKPEEDEEVIENIQEPEEENLDRDLEMHFVDPETKEILWKELCTESYMNDCKDSGMEYENIRELNGLE